MNLQEINKIKVIDNKDFGKNLLNSKVKGIVLINGVLIVAVDKIKDK